MKYLFIAVILIVTTGTAAAQTQTYKIEVTDNTQIQMMSAQWTALEREKRQRQMQENANITQQNFHNFNDKLTALAGMTKDKDILNRIFEAYKLNHKLAQIINGRRYSKEFYKLTSEIAIIKAMLR